MYSTVYTVKNCTRAFLRILGGAGDKDIAYTAHNGSVGSESLVKWDSKSGWITWVMASSLMGQMGHGSQNMT